MEKARKIRMEVFFEFYEALDPVDKAVADKVLAAIGLEL